MENVKYLENIVPLTISFDSFSQESLCNHLDDVNGLGTMIAGFNSLIPMGQRDNFIEKLNELEENLKKLSNKLREKFVYFKSFHIEFNIYAEICRAVCTLLRFMLDTFKSPNCSSIEVFREALQRYSPLDYSYSLMSLLEQDFPCDMIKEMDADNFDDFRNLVNIVFTFLLLMETYSNGLLMKHNLYGPRTLSEKIISIFARIDGSRTNNESGYWPESVKELIHTVRYDNAHLNNHEKADILRDHLAKMFKYDSFFCLVFNRCKKGPEFAFDGYDNQVICSLQPEWCSILVYRSRDWRSAPQNERDQIKREVEECRTDVIPWWKSYTGFPSLLQKSRIQNTGFIAVIKHDLEVAIRSINSDTGPGNWIYATNKEAKEKFILIAGFR